MGKGGYDGASSRPAVVHGGPEAELRALIAVLTAVASAHRLEDVLGVAAEESRRALDAASVSIGRLDGDGSRRTLVHVGEDGDSPLDVPIAFEGSPWGSIAVTARTGGPGLGERDARFLEAIAGQLVAALDRSELFSRVAALAFEDPLTGLANRRALDESVASVVAQALEDDSDVALIFCDVDRLKEINDSFGHAAGDRALVRVGEVLMTVAQAHRDSLVARIGGDEFCVLLPAEDAESARVLAHHASDLLAEAGLPGVSLSSGAASLRRGATSAAALFRAADSAQYAAKRAGRGRVFVAEEGPRALLDEQTALGRRALRDRHASELQRQLGVSTALLDEVLIHAPVLERLEAVAAGLAQMLDAAEWGVSAVSAGDDAVSVLRAGYRRSAAGEEGGSRYEAKIGEDPYAAADFPLIARLASRGGASTVAADDAHADEAEVAFLEEWGYSGVLAASATDEQCAYVVELFADERTLDLAPATAQLRLLVLAAVSAAAATRPPRPAGSSASRHDRPPAAR